MSNKDSKKAGARIAKPVSKKAAAGKATQREELKEHNFADSPFSEEITMHTGVRVFSVSVLYTLVANNDNPLMSAVSEQVQTNEHMIQIGIAGPGNIDVPATDAYPTMSAYRSRFAEHGRADSRLEVARIHDAVADYYGILAAERLIRETDGQARILAVDVEEHNVPSIFLNAVES